MIFIARESWKFIGSIKKKNIYIYIIRFIANNFLLRASFFPLSSTRVPCNPFVHFIQFIFHFEQPSMNHVSYKVKNLDYKILSILALIIKKHWHFFLFRRWFDALPILKRIIYFIPLIEKSYYNSGDDAITTLCKVFRSRDIFIFLLPSRTEENVQ